jgi:hypothetical protein
MHGREDGVLAELASVDRDRRPLLSVRRGAIGADCRSEVIQDSAAVEQVDGLALPDGKKRADSEGNPSPAWGNFDAASVTIYLVRVRAPYGWRLKLGPMSTNAQGVWTISFRTPRIRPGLYTIAFFCRPCGNTFFPSTLPGTPWTSKPSRVLRIRAPHA